MVQFEEPETAYNYHLPTMPVVSWYHCITVSSYHRIIVPSSSCHRIIASSYQHIIVSRCLSLSPLPFIGNPIPSPLRDVKIVVKSFDSKHVERPILSVRVNRLVGKHDLNLYGRFSQTPSMESILELLGESKKNAKSNICWGKIIALVAHYKSTENYCKSGSGS